MTDLRKAAEQPPPVKTYCGGKPNYVDEVDISKERAGSAAREWVGLTDEEIMEGLSSFNEYGNLDGFSFAQWVENKLKEKNT